MVGSPIESAEANDHAHFILDLLNLQKRLSDVRDRQCYDRNRDERSNTQMTRDGNEVFTHRSE